MANMITLQLKIVSDEAEAHEAHFEPGREGRFPLISGRGSAQEGNANYVCGICGLVLAECYVPYATSNAVLDCPSCGARNRFPKKW